MSESSRATSRPPSPDGSWAGTTSTGPPTPWSALWPNWQSEIPDSSTRLLLCSPFYQAAALNLFFFKFTFVSLVSCVKAKEPTQRKQNNRCLPGTPSKTSLTHKDTKHSDASSIYFFKTLVPRKRYDETLLLIIMESSPTDSIKPDFNTGCVVNVNDVNAKTNTSTQMMADIIFLF